MNEIPGQSARTDAARPEQAVAFSEAVRVWVRIALLSFGGPAGQMAVMHRILVEEKRWIGESRFLHALNFCMLLPGPEATQLAIYVGWLLNRMMGGVVAGILFVLPGMIAIMALSWLYALYGDIDFVAALFFGLKAAVFAIVFEAVARIGRRALRNAAMMTLAAASFIAIFVFDVPFPLIIAAAALTGFLGGKAGIAALAAGNARAGQGGGAHADPDSVLGEEIPLHARPDFSRSLRICVLFGALWFGPTIFLFLILGPDDVFTTIAIFFSKMAVATFGGAYAALSYVAQAAVETYGWLAPGEMLDGLGMAETTPGPLIMVTQFVGFMGAFRDPGDLPPLLAGTLGGLLTTWVTFVPCFLWILACGPHAEQLRSNVALSAALTAITGAVVGVILNLAVWFGLHVLFAEVETFARLGMNVAVPVPATFRPAAALLAALALFAVFRLKAGMASVLASCSAAGAALHLLGLAGV